MPLSIHSASGTLEISGLDIVPVAAKVNPCRISCLNKRYLLRPAPAFQLLFAGDGFLDILMVFEPDEPVTVISLCEAIMLSPFMLEDPLMEVE